MSTRAFPKWVFPAGVAFGAAGLYLFNPKSGRKHRAKVLTTTRRLLVTTGKEAEKSFKDAQHHLLGALATAGSHLRCEKVSDEVLVERVRSRMGRVISHPHQIKVASDEGLVTIWGPIPKDEVLPLLWKVKTTPGVKELQNHLSSYDPRELKSGFEHREQFPKTAKSWSRFRRLLAGLTGAGAAAYGLRRRDKTGEAFAAFGAALMVRSMMKTSFPETLAFSEESPGFEIEETININAPLSDLYDFWVDPENYAQAFSHITSVERLGENLYRWTMKGPLGIPIGWEGTITRVVPNTLVEWKSQPGSLVDNFGTARFDPNYDATTRLQIRMFYRPPAGILGRFAAELFGLDPKKVLGDDLRRLKQLFENGELEARKHGATEAADLLKMAGT